MIRRVRRALSILAVALITAGCVIMADVAATLLWKEPVSAAYAAIRQNAASSELDEVEESFRAEVTLPGPAGDPAAQAERLAGEFSDRIENGSPIGRIRASAAGIDQVMIEGTGTGDLERGPGHYPDTALPGQGSTIGVAGHRTTYGAPFRNIDEIEPGDEIELEMPYGTFTYVSEKSEVVDPTDVGVVRDIGRERLVLTACHPAYSAAQRYVVFARLEDIALP